MRRNSLNCLVISSSHAVETYKNDILNVDQRTEYLISVKMDIIYSHLVIFIAVVGAVSNESGESLHQDVHEMESMYLSHC